ncbi:hypothetical protein CONCODRAFT_165582 [Conidiobolus coronatus NRRL 28638]|uniref:Uncharacterized protein n=1 Tax=Conidiobolus coronatus (strain ATCC 28846 / CBS 209.66 / NRRL 28638) TaxID=796925 RepID=A0A137P3X9_CONC2|nr:hypothetical protein CONCODRAFT_165582 [Conidiobolus coronatus NRRL 28638]|eukprot:KXN69604.1 hypothetical protein CONCODRAFT_165582 [Conidiobolus coronatus NRRL 28638]
MKFINIFTTALIAGSALAAPTSHSHNSVTHHRNSRHASYNRAETKHQRYGQHSGSYNLSHSKNAHHAAYSRAEGNHQRRVSHRKDAHNSAYSRAQEQQVASKEQESFFVRPIDLSSFIVPKDIYNTIQELAKIPEKDFISSANELVQKLQNILDISFDFTLRIELLDDKSRAELRKMVRRSLTAGDLSTVQEDIAGDLAEFAQIVYKDEAEQFLEEIKKQFS